VESNGLCVSGAMQQKAFATPFIFKMYNMLLLFEEFKEHSILQD
jgi:hypothetical protein